MGGRGRGHGVGEGGLKPGRGWADPAQWVVLLLLLWGCGGRGVNGGGRRASGGGCGGSAV